MGESSSVAQMMSKWQKTGDEIKPEVKLEVCTQQRPGTMLQTPATLEVHVHLLLSAREG